MCHHSRGFSFMNIPQYLVRDADFMALREALGVSAMHAIVAIGTTIQGKRSNRLKIANPAALARICDLAGEVDAQLLWDSLIGSYLVPIGEGEYSMPIWDEWNRQTIAAWKNGETRRAMQDSVLPSRGFSETVKRSELHRKARAAKRGAIPRDYSPRALMILEEYRKRVSRCLGIEHELDHIVPLALGGMHCPSNLQVLPRSINARKGHLNPQRVPNCYWR